MLPLGLIAFVWRHLANKHHPTSPEAAGGGVSPYTTRSNDTAIAGTVSVGATPAYVADGAAAGTASTSCAVVPVSPVSAAAVGFGVGSSATVIATAVPTSSSSVAVGGDAHHSLFNAVFGVARQPLPTAVAVPCGTGSELTQV